MKFLFTFPIELKEDLREAMEIEKANFEKKTSERLSRMEKAMIEGMAKITARIGGAVVDVKLPYSWNYEFTSDTTMILNVSTPLDILIVMLRNIAFIGEVPTINKLLKNFHITKEKATKQNEESKNKILKALKNYSDAEPELKITEIKE